METNSINTAPNSINTAPNEAHVVIVGTYRGTDWTTAGWSDVHAAQQVIRFTRLTAEEAEEQRTRGEAVSR